MLVYPEMYKYYKIMAVDPGLNKTGISIFNIELSTKQIISIDSTTLVNDHLPDNLPYFEEELPVRLLKLHKLRNAFLSLLEQNQPIGVAIESPFYNPGMPNAYGALTEVVTMFRGTIADYNHNIMVRMVEPLLAKKTIGAKLNNDKGEVKRAIINNQDLSRSLTTHIDLLDEHSIDSVAIGYTFLKNIGACQL
jgi:Holliday junction resolvasome RuvABC endonuclease subunit